MIALGTTYTHCHGKDFSGL